MAENKVNESTLWGLSFLGINLVLVSSEVSAHNSSSFSYSSFVKTAEDEQRARDAIRHSMIWGTVGSAAIATMAYIATRKDPKWFALTFLAGEIVLGAHYMHFDRILKDGRKIHGYTYPPP